MTHEPAVAATRPRIVVLDGYTANPGDASWSGLDELGDVTVYDRTASEITERARDAEVVVTNKVALDEPVLKKLEATRMVSVLATGTNVVDIHAARRLGITVCNVPGYSTASVVQHVFALLFAIKSRVEEHAAHVRAGGWARSLDFSYTLGPIREVAGSTLGIVGLGDIGTRVAVCASAFGMRVVAARHQSRSGKPDALGIERASLDEVVERADVLSLHCPLTDATRHIIGARQLARMKPGAILINTGRGPLVDESALADALDRGGIAGAALDVLSNEPPAPGHPLAEHPRCVVTPHVAWASIEARRRLIAITVENVRAFLAGHPQNVVN